MFLDESGAFDGDAPTVAGGLVVSGAGPNRSGWRADIAGLAPHVPWPLHAAHLRRVGFHVWAVVSGPERIRARPADREAFLPLAAAASAAADWLGSPERPTVAQVIALDRALGSDPGFAAASHRALDLTDAVRRAALSPVVEGEAASLVAAVRRGTALELAPSARWATLVARAAQAAGWPTLRPLARFPEDHAALRALRLPCVVALPAAFGEDVHPAFVAADLFVNEVRNWARSSGRPELADLALRVGAKPLVVWEEG